MFLDKDMMKVKLEFEGTTYYFSSGERLQSGLCNPGGINGFGLMRNANYAIKDGKFLKNRSVGDQVPNTILAMGRDEINALFDFMEAHK